MSLDVYLELDAPSSDEPRQAIFIRRNGATEEITRQEWDAIRPGQEPVIASVVCAADVTVVFERNITHNLNTMAARAGIYEYLWQPDRIGITTATQLVDPLERGLGLLFSYPERFKALNPLNGWGNYHNLIAFVQAYVAACRKHPTARVRISR